MVGVTRPLNYIRYLHIRSEPDDFEMIYFKSLQERKEPMLRNIPFKRHFVLLVTGILLIGVMIPIASLAQSSSSKIQSTHTTASRLKVANTGQNLQGVCPTLTS